MGTLKKANISMSVLFLMLQILSLKSTNAQSDASIAQLLGSDDLDRSEDDSFTDPNNETLLSIVVDNFTGKVYVGAKKKIYQLLPSLKLETEAVMDYNRVLVIDYANRSLISCGRMLKGLCTVHRLHNISEHDEPVQESVVPEFDWSHIVALVAPGPKNLTSNQVLYVGVPFFGAGRAAFDSTIPAITRRKLDGPNMFSQVDTPPPIKVKGDYRERSVLGFNYKGFSYFVSSQRNIVSRGNPISTKLVRICHDDPHYYSYTDVPLVCETSSGHHYYSAQTAYVDQPGSDLAKSLGISVEDQVLFVVFQRPDVTGPGDSSALCVYDLPAIEQKFTENIQRCFAGNGTRGYKFFGSRTPCLPTNMTISDDFCGSELNTPIEGEVPIKVEPVFVHQFYRFTAVAFTSTGNSTVAFLGTDKGRLIKAVIESPVKAQVYGEKVIDAGVQIRPKMIFDNKKESIYVLTSNKVSRERVQECHRFSSNECLRARDPYCGWCVPLYKCSPHYECKDPIEGDLHWISKETDQFPAIYLVGPPQSEITTIRNLSLLFNNSPVPEGRILCEFSFKSKEMVTIATRHDKGITCSTPSIDPGLVPQDQNAFTANLSIKAAKTFIYVVTDFTFYYCNTFKTCTSCFSSSFSCRWLIETHECIPERGNKDDRVSTKIKKEFCPRIEAINGRSSQIIMPEGTISTFKVQIKNYKNILKVNRLVCQVKIENSTKTVTAFLLYQNTVFCYDIKFSYESKSPNLTVELKVFWNDNNSFDNPENINVLIYKCQELATSCDSCLNIPSKYDCGWCSKEPKSCTTKNQCIASHEFWKDKNSTCSEPNDRESSTGTPL